LLKEFYNALGRMSIKRQPLLRGGTDVSPAGRRQQPHDFVQQPGYYVYYDRAPPDAGAGSWGCMWIMFILVLVVLIAAFFIIWYVPPPGSARIPANTPMAHSSTTGMTIPGLGNVDMVQEKTGGSGSCGGVTWEIYNTTTHLCQPRIGGLDSELFDRGVNPCDSFYEHTCGAWLAHYRPLVDAEQHPRRVDRAFGYVQRYNQHVLTKIIENHIGGPIFNFYSSCVNAHVHKQQVAQQKAYRDHLLQELNVKEIHDLPQVFAKLLLMGFTTPISLSMEVHPFESKVVPLFGHDGFPGVTSEHVRELFAQIVADPKVLDERVEDFMTLNEQIELHRPKNDPGTMAEFMAYLEGRAPQDFVYVDDVHRLMRMSPVFSPTILMQELKLTIPSYSTAWIRDKSYYTWLFSRDGPIQSISVRQWNAYVQFSVLYSSGDFFPKLPSVLLQAPPAGTRSIGVADEDAEPLGLPSMKRSHLGLVTHDQCKQMTETLLPGYVSKAYLQLSCSDELQRRVVDIAGRVRDELKKIVRDSAYMDARDKRNTLQKLDAIIIRVGQPNAWDVEPFGWELVAGDYMKNLDHVRRFRVKRNFERFTGGQLVSSMETSPNPAVRVDRDAMASFQSPLSLVNAMYSPMSNTISIYAGILQFPFVDMAYDNVTLYATIGSVVGHELAHSLDPTGRRFDADGVFHKGRMAWWQTDTVKEYTKRLDCVADEFGSPHVVGDLSTHCPNIAASDYGRLTITEDTADILGVTAAYRAMASAAPARAADGERQGKFV
jgi:hypothetical protein